MPKMKTETAAKKRVRTTGTGRVVRSKAFKSHLNEKKSSRRKRRLSREAELTGGNLRRVRKMLGM